MTEQVIIEVTIAAASDVVWAALRDPDLIRRWHGWDYDGLEDEVSTIFLESSEEDTDARTFLVDNHDRFTLHDADRGAVVRITRVPKGNNPEWDDWYDDITEGWTTFLEQLRFGVEQHGLAERRTVFLEGRIRDDAAALDELGLDVATLSVGDRYEAASATSDRLSGVIRLRTPRQIAMTVDDLGPGQLIVAEQPVNPQRPHGGWMILLTTYGQSDDVHAALRQRWDQWWRSIRVAETVSVADER